ncbi:MAG TPA: alpha/beta hydrolase [Bryobacteraceae bacterium]|jgi:acetyl esterase|nr:alpha/beta hydrolase [Bryobacteraceae bacterium]
MPELITRSERLHPEVRALLEMMDAQGAPALESQDPLVARKDRVEGMKMLGGEPRPLGRVEDFSIPGPDGDVPVRLYAMEHGGVRPALIYFHGGGWVFGNLDTHDSVCRDLAAESGAVVISVDYRLSPEVKFPAAVNDSYAATLWIAANAERLGIDARRISVGGDSAGGNLATVIAMRCRDAGGPALARQLLIYPATDLSSFDTASYRELAEGYFLTRAAMQWFTGHYLASGDQSRLPEASPLHAPNLSGLPPAFVITAEFDPLRDEGEAYAARLQQAGVPVTVKRYPGMVHGFVSMRGVVSGGRQAIQEAAKFVGQYEQAESA